MSLEQLEEIVYPSSDGEPMAETGTHVNILIELITLLRLRYAERSDVYIIGNIFLFWEKGNPAARRSPDVMVIKGVPKTPERDSFKTWEENAVPCVVFEATSNKTKEEDLGPKRELYLRLGVKEYFLFDPLGHFLERPLMGYTLHRVARNGNGHGDPADVEVENEYAEIRAAEDGSLVSRELGVRITPYGESLVLFDWDSGQRLLAPRQLSQQVDSLLADLERMRARADEEYRRAEEVATRADDEKRRADDEKRRADDEKRRADDAAKRVLELEEKLRSLLPPSP